MKVVVVQLVKSYFDKPYFDKLYICISRLDQLNLDMS